MTEQPQDCPIAYRDAWLSAKEDMINDEEYVRNHLEDVYFEGSIFNNSGDIVHQGWGIADGKTEVEAWAAAKVFVDKRKDEIADVEDEIHFIEDYDSPRAERILAREQAALAKLRKGFK